MFVFEGVGEKLKRPNLTLLAKGSVVAQDCDFERCRWSECELPKRNGTLGFANGHVAHADDFD